MDLAEAEAAALAAVAIEQAAGEGDAELVGVGEAVAAAEPAFAEQLVEAEIQLRAVENRQQPLVFMLAVQVEQSGLECLDAVSAAFSATGSTPQPALENESAVDAEGGQAQAGIRRAAGRLPFQLVVDDLAARAGAQEGARGFHRPVEPGRQVDSAALDQGPRLDPLGGNQVFVQIAVEGGQLASKPEAEVGVEVGPGAEAEMGQAVEGFGDVERVRQRVDEFDALEVEIGLQGFGSKAQPRLPVEVVARGGVEAAAGEIDEPVAVADRGEIDEGAPVVAQGAIVLEIGVPAVCHWRRVRPGDTGESGIVQAVVPQPGQPDRVHRPVGEIAEFGAEHGATVADQPGQQRGVVMRRQIQIPGRFDIEAAGAR